MIDYEKVSRFRIADKPEVKREVVKLILFLKLREKHKSNLINVNILSDFPIKDDKKVDIYYDNLKTKKVVLYKLYKKDSPASIEEYNSYQSPFMETEVRLIHLRDVPDNVEDIYEYLEDYI